MSLKKNVISNFILTASTFIFPLISLPYITRTLSTASIGQFFYIDSFTQYFILFSAIGIPYYGVREVAKLKFDRQRISQFVIELVIIQFALSFIFCGLFLTFPFFIKTLRASSDLIRIGCITIVSNAFLIEWFYQGIENFSYITVRSIVIKSLSVIMILFLVVNKNDSNIYYLILALTVLANAVLNFGNFIGKHYANFKFESKIFWHLRPLWILFSINISVSLYTLMDTIILGSMTNPVQVSYYNIPLKIVKLFFSVMGGIGLVFIPRMSSFFVDNDIKGIQNLMTKSISIVLLLGIPFFLVGVFFPEEILFVVSGKQYIHAKVALQILAIVPLIIGLNNVFGTQYLLAIGREKKILYATIFGFFGSLILNICLIPHYGFVGSSIACVLAELIVCIIIFKSAKDTIKINVDFNLLFLIIVSSIFALVFLLIFKNISNQILLMIFTGLCYVCSFGLFQIFIFKNGFINSIIKFRSR